LSFWDPPWPSWPSLWAPKASTWTPKWSCTRRVGLEARKWEGGIRSSLYYKLCILPNSRSPLVFSRGP
jgi:hypothetical protein